MNQTQIWLAPMLHKPLRPAMTVLGVALGVGSVIGTVLASRAAVGSLETDALRTAGELRLEITRPGGVALEHGALLQRLCGEALFLPVVEDSALVESLGEFVRVLGVDLVSEPLLRAGVLPENQTQAALETMLLGQGVAVSEDLARQLGLEVGDDLEVVAQTRRSSLRVAATLDAGTSDVPWSRTLLVDVALAQELFGRLDRVDRLEVAPRAPQDPQVLAARIAELLPASYQVGPASERQEEARRMVRALDFNLTALSGVSVLVGSVLIATTLATSVVQRRSQFAVLRSLGASPGQIGRVLLCEALAIGGVGGILGALLGWLGALAALGSVSTTYATVAEGALPGQVRFDVPLALFGLVLGLVSAALAALLPLREAMRTPPVQGLRAEHPHSGAAQSPRHTVVGLAVLGLVTIALLRMPPMQDRPLWALLACLAILSTLLVLAAPLVGGLLRVLRRVGRSPRRVSLHLAQVALQAGRRRAAWAASAVGVALALAVAMTTMVSSFRTSVVDWTAQAIPADLFVRPLAASGAAGAGSLDPEVVQLAREVFGGQAVDAYHQSKAYFRGEPILLGGGELALAGRTGGVPFLDGRSSPSVFRQTAEQGGALINEPFARRFGVQRGQVIEIMTPAGALQREVMGVYRDYSGHMGRAVLNLPDFLAHYPDDGPRNLEIFLGSDADVASARERLARALGGRFAVAILDNRQVRADVMHVFDRTFQVTIGLQVLSSAVAAIAVVAVLLALIWERKREIALVRVLGASRLQVVGMVLVQALVLGLAGVMGGLVVGLGVGYVLVKVVNLQSFGWSLDFGVPFSVVTTVLCVLPACLIAGLFPALQAWRSAPKESLRADGA